MKQCDIGAECAMSGDALVCVTKDGQRFEFMVGDMKLSEYLGMTKPILEGSPE